MPWCCAVKRSKKSFPPSQMSSKYRFRTNGSLLLFANRCCQKYMLIIHQLRIVAIILRIYCCGFENAFVFTVVVKLKRDWQMCSGVSLVPLPMLYLVYSFAFQTINYQHCRQIIRLLPSADFWLHPQQPCEHEE